MVRVAAAIIAFFFAHAGCALAGGGNYLIQGGTTFERAQVRNALQASAFNWSLVPRQIAITIGQGPVSGDAAVPGQIWLDPDLLDAGQLSWGVVQHEYAHQVDFFLLTDSMRAELQQALGGTAWCAGAEPGLAHDQYGCERFASTVAWAYWPSFGNCMKPSDIGNESGAMPPAAFRTLLSSLLRLSS